MPHAPADAAHAKDADGQLVQLPATDRVADALEFFRLIRAVLEKSPGAKKLEEVAEDEIADRQCVRVRRKNDFHAALPAGGHVDVFQADAAAANDLQSWGFGQQCA